LKKEDGGPSNEKNMVGRSRGNSLGTPIDKMSGMYDTYLKKNHHKPLMFHIKLGYPNKWRFLDMFSK